ncbi:Peptidase M15A [[Leptolyngbya] sp. PCC 7376]|uniref:D-Ala-D-Ala carboxypeptidase family metallohydrolase n=1 Tax=[Leptolyngbya] sp. PCC 7376 TaxID=111781 RepID=UPI00029F3F0C|nr:D-Ala-D-Ala carboxypeptidase family metallohydrolase [[Leptolyngbya] sp. PCC 7376]AFY39017.1 Peptidase M15A [[Leptolyngbya] sp. PCC 7376]
MAKPQVTKAILLKDVTDKDTVKWVQSQLASGDYLKTSDVDGLVGPKSIGALREFKEEMLLAYPEAIGAGTIDALAKLSPKPEAGEFIPKITKAILLKDVTDAETVKWVQSKLVNGAYLSQSDVDGKVGQKTIAALRKFKEEGFLAYPEALGASTIDALDELTPKHQVSEQGQVVQSSSSGSTGPKTGKSRTLPVVGLVYENQMIVPNSNITWGEMTRGFSRLPMSTSQFGSQEQIVRNMMATAKAFGKVRQKFGSPIRITSAYRPPNLKIGASRSQHKYARALDVQPMNGNYQGLLNAIKAVPEIKGVGIAGPRKGFWHMDIRPIARRITFGY